MKRVYSILLMLVVLFSLCGCTRTSVDESADIALTFIYEEKSISVTLEADETARVVSILIGNHYDPIFCGIPSCGFDKNISLKVGNRIFAIVCDTCNSVQDLSNLRCFDIPTEDMEYIHSLFEKYGGYFPCV